MEHFFGFGMPKELGKRASGAVTGNFIMLDALGGGDQAGVFHLGRGVFIDHLLAFFDEPFHCLAFLPAMRLAEIVENLFEPLGMSLGLL